MCGERYRFSFTLLSEDEDRRQQLFGQCCHGHLCKTFAGGSESRRSLSDIVGVGLVASLYVKNFTMARIGMAAIPTVCETLPQVFPSC